MTYLIAFLTLGTLTFMGISAYLVRKKPSGSTRCLRCGHFYFMQHSNASMPDVFCDSGCQAFYQSEMDKVDVWRG